MNARLFKTLAGLQAFMASHRGAFHVTFMHDNECSPSRCVCEPWFEVRDLNADTMLDGLRKQREWERETSS